MTAPANWVVRRTRLDVPGLYRSDGPYWYAAGWNWRAVTAFAAGGLLAVGGSYSAPARSPPTASSPSSNRSPTTAGPSASPPRCSSTPC